MSNKRYKAIHHPTVVYWQPVTEFDPITTPDGTRIALRPEEHVKLIDLHDEGGKWMNFASEFIRRYGCSLDADGLRTFMRYYESTKIPEWMHDEELKEKLLHLERLFSERVK